MEYLTVFICVMLHELGHVITALVTGARVYSIRILPVGLNALINEEGCSIKKGAALYLSGPCVNILLLSVCLIINSYYLVQSDNMRFFISSNFFLAAFNLLPVIPLDGGKTIRLILSDKVGLFHAYSLMRRVSVAVAAVLVVISLALLLAGTNNFSLLLVALYIFFVIRLEKTEVAIMNVKNVVYRRSRLLKKGIYPARDLVAVRSLRVGEVLKSMDFDRFHIIYVLDENLKILKIFTEQEVLDHLLENSADITFGELIDRISVESGKL